jgi:single-stranded DNA-binding protein
VTKGETKMLKCVNIHIVEGYATQDAKTGIGKTGTAYTKINLRTEREFTKSGESECRKFTTYHNLAAFGIKAKCLDDVKEGDFVRVSGRGESRKYTDPKTNIARRIHEIIVEESFGTIPAICCEPTVSSQPIAIDPAPAMPEESAELKAEEPPALKVVPTSVPVQPQDKDNEIEADPFTSERDTLPF